MLHDTFSDSKSLTVAYGRAHLIFLACFLLAGFPFLVGYGVLPQTNLTAEALAVLGLALVLLLSAQGAVSNTYIWQLGKNWQRAGALWLLLAVLAALAAATCIQALWFGVSGTADAYLAYVCYLIAAGLAIFCGHLSTSGGNESGVWVGAMATATLAAALVAAAASYGQYFGLDLKWALVSPVVDAGRTFGFVRQPNHQGTFLNLGLVALLGLVWLGRVRWCFAVPGALFLISAMVTTGSRTGLVQLLGIALLLCLSNPKSRQGARRYAAPLLVVLAGVAAWLALYLGSQAGWGAFYGVDKLQQTSSEGLGVRLLMWRETWELVLARPWTGQGVLHFQTLFFLSGAAAGAGVLMGNAHNLFLQLAFDFGLPLTLLTALVLVLLLWRARRSVANPAGFLGLGMVGCVLTHSMLEFPLWYTYFLLPFGWWLGTLTRPLDVDSRSVQSTTTVHQKESVGNHRTASAVLAVFAAITFAVPVWMNRDFFRLTPAYMAKPDLAYVAQLKEGQGIFWFRRFSLFHSVVNEKTTRENSQHVLHQSASLGCQLADPVYQHNYILALWQQGRREEAKSILYILWALNKQTLDRFKESLNSSDIDNREELLNYVVNPVKVRHNYDTFNEVCMGELHGLVSAHANEATSER